ncbi:MAG: hypothetical protein J5685_10555 [Clostridiales bacterium]|nr:hypothetical protein [Clostridiales bacterium]
MKESGGATAFRIISAVIATLLIGAATFMLLTSFTIFSPKFWVKALDRANIRELLIDSLDDLPSDIAPYIDEENMKADMVDLMLDEFYDLLENGDDEIETDAWNDFFDEYLNTPELTSHAVPAEVEEYREQLLQVSSDGLESINDAMKEADLNKTFKKTSATLTVPAIVMLVISFGMFALCIPFHKNKFRVVRALGISITISEGLALFISLGVSAILASIISELDAHNEKAVKELITSVVNQYLTITNGTLVVSLAIGIVLIVVGVIFVKRANEISDAMDYDSRPTYTGSPDDYDSYTNTY